ncbi:hypothetical protein [Natronococcus roseus]
MPPSLRAPGCGHDPSETNRHGRLVGAVVADLIASWIVSLTGPT